MNSKFRGRNPKKNAQGPEVFRCLWGRGQRKSFNKEIDNKIAFYIKKKGLKMIQMKQKP